MGKSNPTELTCLEAIVAPFLGLVLISLAVVVLVTELVIYAFTGENP